MKIRRGDVMRKMAARSLADLARMAERPGVRDESFRRHSDQA